MTGTDWLLALHLLSAVSLGAALTGFWVLTLATRSSSTLPGAAVGRLNAPLVAAVSIGSLGTLVFGVWLAIVEDAYHPWDGWVIAAIVLWAIGVGAGQRAGRVFESGGPEARSRALTLQVVSSLAILAVLVLMIWKPGA